MTYKEVIDQEYLDLLKSLELPVKVQANPWLVLYKHGDDLRAPTVFNVQVYQNKEGRLTLVTNDKDTLDRLLAGEDKIDEEGKRIILLDDSGWGFPIGGVLCGVYDFKTDQFHAREVEVEYFQNDNFDNQLYLDRFRDRALEIIEEINPSLEETVIRICTGYINIKAKDSLRESGGLLVTVAQIGEPLQTLLEEEHRKYIEELIGEDLYYDPKELSEQAISQRFHEVVNFAERNDIMHLAKSGWKYFQTRDSIF